CLKNRLYPNHAAPPKMIAASSRTKSHFMKNWICLVRPPAACHVPRASSARNRNNANSAGLFRFSARPPGAAGRLASWKETAPEPTQGSLLFVCPGEMTILAIKLLRENPQSKQNTRHRRSNGLPRQLRILNPGGAALRAPQHGGSDIRIACLPLGHQLLCSFKIVVLDLYFNVDLRL